MRAAAALFLSCLALAGCRASAPHAPPLPVPLLTREAWGAAEPVAPMQPHVPDGITIHHTAVRQAPQRTTADKLRGLQRFSQERSTLGDGRVKEPWADVPYHYYIAADGGIAEGREVGYVGDSNTRYDLSGQIQVVLEGNFEEEQPTAGQYESLWRLTHALARRWRVAPEHVVAHRDHTATACPGAALYAWLPALRRHLAEHP